ncbi:MAG TPA: lysylphosphatidylglycerol synthase transmembrane domain-containing protein [Polyangia bacterium]|nr:lysylphosphatidylglycerol synthase transmembrane domain-containing protein [Polyangia bacterium]
MRPRGRRAAAIALRGLCGAAAVAYVAHHLSWGAVWGTLRHARTDLLAAVVVINAGMLWVRAVRLRVLLQPTRATLPRLFLAVLTSSAINNVLPLRAGDLARLFMLENVARISKTVATAVALVEKLLEVVVLAALALAAACDAPGQAWARGAGAAGLGLALASLCLLNWVTEGPVVRLPAFTRKLAERMAPGTHALRNPRALAAALGASLAAWCCELAMIMLCARAIGLAIGPALAVVVLLGINLAMLLPSLPANAGAFEGAAAVVLVLAGVPKPAAVAFAVLYHLVQIVPVTVAGLALLARNGMTLRSFETRAEPTSAG